MHAGNIPSSTSGDKERTPSRQSLPSGVLSHTEARPCAQYPPIFVSARQPLLGGTSLFPGLALSSLKTPPGPLLLFSQANTISLPSILFIRHLQEPEASALGGHGGQHGA